jgi:hypothetical protein
MRQVFRWRDGLTKRPEDAIEQEAAKRRLPEVIGTAQRRVKDAPLVGRVDPCDRLGSGFALNLTCHQWGYGFIEIPASVERRINSK